MKKDTSLKLIVTDAIIRSRFLHTETELEQLLDSTVHKLNQNFHTRTKILTEREVGIRFPLLSPPRLAHMRERGSGPAYLPAELPEHPSPRYRLADIEDWILLYYSRDLTKTPKAETQPQEPASVRAVGY